MSTAADPVSIIRAFDAAWNRRRVGGHHGVLHGRCGADPGPVSPRRWYLPFTGFLIFDLNRIAQAGEISTGDAVLLAVSVYLDVLNLFLALLSLLTALRGDER